MERSSIKATLLLILALHVLSDQGLHLGSATELQTLAAGASAFYEFAVPSDFGVGTRYLIVDASGVSENSDPDIYISSVLFRP